MADRNRVNTFLKVLITAVGLINFIPVAGVLSGARITQLYGVGVESGDLEILMRHRAVLFGILGALILISVVKKGWRLPACVAGLISMVSFIVLAWLVGDFGETLQRIILIDIAGSVMAVLAIVLLVRQS